MAKIALLISLIVIFDNINTQPDRNGKIPQYPVNLDAIKGFNEKRMKRMRTSETDTDSRPRSIYDNVPETQDTEPSTSETTTASRPSSIYENVPESASGSVGESSSRPQSFLGRLLKRKRAQSIDPENESEGSSSSKRARKAQKTAAPSESDSDSETEAKSSPSTPRRLFGKRAKKTAAPLESVSDSKTEAKSSSSRFGKFFRKRGKKSATAKPATVVRPTIHPGYTMDQDELLEYLQYILGILENTIIEEGTYRLSPDNRVYADDPREIKDLSSIEISGKIKKAFATSFDKFDLTGVTFEDTSDEYLESVWSSATHKQQKILALLFKHFNWLSKQNEGTKMTLDNLWIAIGPSVSYIKPRDGKDPNEEEMMNLPKRKPMNTFMSELNQWYINNH